MKVMLDSGAQVEAPLAAFPATREQRLKMLALLKEHLADELQATMELVGTTWDQFAKLVETAGEVRALVRGGTEVGYYWIEERERTLHVHAIFVLPEYRSQGIGAWAFHMLDSEFRRRCDYIELGVRGDNVRAQAFYRRLGFETERQIPRPSFLIMRKPLSSAA